MRKHHFVKPLFVALLLSSAALSASAQIYKWTDENGRTHFSDQKPLDQQNVEQVKVQISKGNPSQRQAPQPNTPAKEAELRQKAQRLSTQQGKDKVQLQCESNRANLARLNEEGRLQINDKGKMRFLSDAEISDRKQRYQRFLDENC